MSNGGTTATPDQRHSLVISTKCLDIVLNPFERHLNILDCQVAAEFVAESTQPSEWTKSKLNFDNDHISGAGEGAWINPIISSIIKRTSGYIN